MNYTCVAYNVPELKGMELVLDYDTIAQIYTNDLTMWNDQRIKDLNTAHVAAALPAKPIVVVTQSISSAVTRLFTTLLNATVPDFASAVHHSPKRNEKKRREIYIYLRQHTGGSRVVGVFPGAGRYQSVPNGHGRRGDTAAVQFVFVRVVDLLRGVSGSLTHP